MWLSLSPELEAGHVVVLLNIYCSGYLLILIPFLKVWLNYFRSCEENYHRSVDLEGISFFFTILIVSLRVAVYFIVVFGEERYNFMTR